MKIGLDIVEIARLEQSISRSGEAFLQRVYDAEELKASDAISSPQRRLEFLAGRWAAKEAIAKVMGCGIGGECKMNELIVVNAQSGAPRIKLCGAAYETAKRLGLVNWNVSISHERHYAATVACAEEKKQSV